MNKLDQVKLDALKEALDEGRVKIENLSQTLKEAVLPEESNTDDSNNSNNSNDSNSNK